MLKSVEMRKRARQEGGEELCQRLENQTSYKRLYWEDTLLVNWGQPLKAWPWFNEVHNLSSTRPPPKTLKLNKYPFSDQHALFSKFTSDLLAHLSPSSPFYQHQFGNARFTTARRWFRQGTSTFQRFLMPPMILLWEVVMPVLCLIVLVATKFVHFFVLIGLRFPVLWLFRLTISTAGIYGKEILPPGENGYTKVFRGGEDVDFVDLEGELMTRNSETSISLRDCITIAISYKHYPNEGKVSGDDGKMSETDLRAIARLIKEAAPCNLRFWIDGKLPISHDDSFERWINRGVRPYGRYITLICPSAIEYAHASFWLANEYHIAAAAKGVMYLEGDQFFYELRYGYDLDLYQRFLQVIIGAEDIPLPVRDQDKRKTIHWALCCLTGDTDVLTRGLSPCIDSMTMTGDYSHEAVLLNRVTNVILKYGPQELPVAAGRSWNANSPLLMADAPDVDFDLLHWLGFCLDGSPMTIYYVHERRIVEACYPTIMVVEVTLDRPHFAPGEIRVTRKVLRELESSILLNCKFVTLPWRCEWV